MSSSLLAANEPGAARPHCTSRARTAAETWRKNTIRPNRLGYCRGRWPFRGRACCATRFLVARALRPCSLAVATARARAERRTASGMLSLRAIAVIWLTTIAGGTTPHQVLKRAPLASYSLHFDSISPSALPWSLHPISPRASFHTFWVDSRPPHHAPFRDPTHRFVRRPPDQHAPQSFRD